MRTLTALLHSRWAIPGVSGLLIVVSILAERLFDQQLLVNALMVAAAAVAGTPIVIKATRAFSTVSTQYPLKLIVTDGRWEVAGIEIFPALGSKATEPQPRQSTAGKPPSAATSSDPSTSSGDSVFGKP